MLPLEEFVEAKLARALATLINTDDYFAVYLGGRARYVPPLIEDDLISLPDCLVQNVIERDTLNRMLGGFAKPTVHLRVLLFEPERTRPYEDGDSDRIENRIVQLERVVEAGSLETDGTRNGQGKLIDPDSAADDPPVKRYLNDLSPTVFRFPPQRRDLSPSGDQTSIAMVYPLIVSYQTTQNRLTRRTL